MSDAKSNFGDPVEEPAAGDTDVVARARRALEEAEAARGEFDEPSATADDAPIVESSAAEPAAEDDVPWYDRPEDVPLDPEPLPASALPAASEPAPHATETVAYEQDPSPVVTASEPTVGAAAPVGLVAATAQPIFVQAPEPPRPRNNRGAAGAIGLVATLAFAAVFFAAILAVQLIYRLAGVSELGAVSLRLLASSAFWVPVVVFFLAFWILGAFINRGRWGHWVVWGLLVGAASYGGYLLGQFVQAQFWQLSGRQIVDLWDAQALAPLAIVSFVVGRELTIWFGAWVARRGRRVNEVNAEALREYERTLEAGPQLHQV